MSNSAINSNHRELWIDCARGIAILLVIVGHTISGVLSGAIYSFHINDITRSSFKKISQFF